MIIAVIEHKYKLKCSLWNRNFWKNLRTTPSSKTTCPGTSPLRTMNTLSRLASTAIDNLVMLSGAYFARTDEQTIQKMIALSNVKPNERVIDLGAGDGAIIVALAKKNIAASGVEINPFLVRKARQRITKLNLDRLASIHQGNFWNLNLSPYDVVFVYGIGYIMMRLETKLLKELKPGSRVVSNYFQFPSWKPKAYRNNVYLYRR